MANSRPAGESRLALLGPQATNWTRDSLSELQSKITADDSNKGLLGFLKQAVTDLPSLWPLLDESLGSRLDFLPGAVDFAPETLAQLAEFANGSGTLDPQRLTNTALAPLTVVAQILDFVQTTASPGSEEGLAGLASVQGFCIGFLSAAALAAATDWAEFEHNAANAIRLAACVGIIVDAYEAWRPADDRVAALSVRWKTEADRTFLETCLDQIPAAYVSCITDANSQTITLRERSLEEFSARLKEAGVASSSVGLRGRYHHALNDEAARALMQVCADRSDILGLPDAKHLRMPLRSTEDGRLITTGALHDVALQLILCKPAHWFQTVKRAMAHHSDPAAAPVVPVTLGGENCVPRSLRRIKTGGDHGDEHNTAAADTRGRDDLEIAVVGMACRFPRAEDLASFWELLVRGETAIGTMPPSRFDPAQVAREPKLATYWGNFLEHPDLFDHRFFSISGREAKSMDPQQRLALQVAYEALESSGYLGASGKAEDVGCYLGVGAVEYEANVSSEKANSFAALGTLRAFISGRISHFFGWTGPSITFDTACSSSAVAIHTACKALVAGECSMALAGGVNVITSPTLHQNLAAASFLNPNGASKAFDAEAGGYCRGEGAGIVVLKTLSRAIADGDKVLGVIAASAVNQGSNCSSITVPDSGSQSSLYQRVMRDARIAPLEVGYVEAHGTGTPVGDPIEYESVRHALTGGSRDEAVLLGSVKDNIGHTEAASGVAGLIKVLLMMQNATVPKQAGFTSLSPRINPCPEITVPTKTTRWTAKGRRVALVNNYGAAGSNAALLVRSHTDASADSLGSQQQPAVNSSSTVYPVLLAAKTANALQEYMAALQTRLPRMAAGFESIAYRLARGCNPSFDHRAAFVAGDVNGAVATLEQAVAAANSPGSSSSSSSIVSSATRLPVVLCFGGQTGHTVRVSRELYDSCDLLRHHLDACDAVCSRLGLPTIFPAVFHDEPVKDLVALHCMLLALQISSARCWLDSGLVIDTVIGHSFGQLSAMCIAGSMTLEDTFRFVAGRARLMRDGWGPERGTMLSVECNEDEVADVVKTVSATTDGLQVDVACFNGPRSFVLAGDAVSIAHAKEECSRRAFKTSALQNSHAYHSHLADPVLPGLKGVAYSIAIQPPRLRVETCSAEGNWTPGDFTAENVAQHTRLPVYFGDAVERIAARLPSAVWLEAGSATPIVAMARRVISGRAGRTDEFVPLELGGGNAASTLAKAACQLWKAGSDARPWLFHATSHGRHQPVVDLPPYQFEKTSHWITLRPAPPATSSQPILPPPSKETALVSAITSRRGQAGDMFFSVDTSHAVFELAARGHAVMGLPLCPASMYLELAARAVEASGKRASTTGSGAMPHFEDLVMSAPLGLGAANSVFLRLQPTSVPDKWDFVVFSQPAMSGAAVDAKVGVGQETQHAKGRIGWAPFHDTGSEKHLRLLQRFAAQGMKRLSSAATTGISGTMVYKLFSDVVTYAEYFRGVQSVSASAHHAVGQVSASALVSGQKRWFADGLMTGITEAVVVDNFLQVAGIHVNCLSPREDDQVFMCTAVEEVMFAARFAADRGGDSRAWHVYTRYEPSAHTAELRNDIFVCDAASGDLVLVVLGAVFKSVPFRSVARSLARINRTAVVPVPLATSTADSDNGGKVQDSGYQSDSHSPGGDRPADEQHTDPISPSEQPLHRTGVSVSTTSNVIGLMCGLLSSILEIPVDEITADSSLDTLGVDSLLVPEVASEIERQFGVSLTQDELLRCTDVRAVAMLVQPTSPSSEEARQDSATHGVDNETKPVNSVPAERLTNGNGDALVNGSSPLSSDDCNLALISHESFRDTKPSYDSHAATTGFAGFYGDAFQLQSELVVRYVVEAFKSLGCDLPAMSTGDQVPVIPFQQQHKKLIPQLYRILQDAGLVAKDADGVFRRSAKPTPATASSQLHEEMLSRFPKHASETKLLSATGPRLAECLSGTADPIALIFQNAKARALLEDVYTNAPMFKTGTLALAEYLGSVLARLGGRRQLRILELGAGTGGTSKHMIETLATAGGGEGFTYTFTDLSPSLVAAAKRKFAKWPMVQYAVVNVEEDPPAHLLNAFDIVLSTNCIHATHDLVKSTTNIRKMLRPDGILCLVELTRNLYWFDLVFGLLEGWWLFDDGREHALAHERRWDTSLRAAGFEWVDWTSSAARESETLRVITASPYKVDDAGAGRRDSVPAGGQEEVGRNEALATKETVTFKEVDNLQLQADIFYPDAAVEAGRRLPIALMIHGGGHIMLSRRDVRPEQTAMLLRSGFLPISVDYRLCPETSLLAGPMSDVADALTWARTVLPRAQLARADVVVDPDRVVAVGWSTGGHLAMTLAWTTPQPPSAILALYCPTDYEDSFWTKPNVPDGVDAASFVPAAGDEEEAGIWEAVFDAPVTAYNVPAGKRALGGWLARDDARSRLAQLMNVRGLTLPVLLHGLDKKTRGGASKLAMAMPSPSLVARASPLAQIRAGRYGSPTFLVHPRQDDLIPWQQAERTWLALRDASVDAELRVVEDVPHLFDLSPRHPGYRTAMAAVEEGYAFLCRHVGLEWLG